MYKDIALTSFKEEAAYRVETVMSILSSSIQLVVLWFLWSAIFSVHGSATLKGFTLPVMITYISISTILSLFNRSFTEYMMENDIRTGFISLLLTKPISYPIYYLYREIGRMSFSLLTRGTPIVIIALLAFNISMPFSPLFFLSVALGFLINFFLIFITGLWSFWTSGSIWGIRFTRVVISDIISGSIIPIYLFPAWLSQIAYFLPFQAIYSTPLLIYVGQISGMAALGALAVQLAWVAVLGGITYAVWRLAKNKTTSQGG